MLHLNTLQQNVGGWWATYLVTYKISRICFCENLLRQCNLKTLSKLERKYALLAMVAIKMKLQRQFNVNYLRFMRKHRKQFFLYNFISSGANVKRLESKFNNKSHKILYNACLQACNFLGLNKIAIKIKRQDVFYLNYDISRRLFNFFLN